MLGFIGDIHCNDKLLSKAIVHLKLIGCTALYSVGDIADGSGSYEECVRLLVENQVISVKGNHDEWFAKGANHWIPNFTAISESSEQSIQFARSLPTHLWIQPSLVLCHSVYKNNMGRLSQDDSGYALEVNDDLHELFAIPRKLTMVRGHAGRVWANTFQNVTVISLGDIDHPEGGIFSMDVQNRSGQFWGWDGTMFMPQASAGLPAMAASQ